MDKFILWCLNEWDRNPDTLEWWIQQAIDKVSDDHAFQDDFHIYMDVQSTANKLSNYEMEDFHFEELNVEQSSNVPEFHIKFGPVIERNPRRFSGKRESYE